MKTRLNTYAALLAEDTQTQQAAHVAAGYSGSPSAASHLAKKLNAAGIVEKYREAQLSRNRDILGTFEGLVRKLARRIDQLDPDSIGDPPTMVAMVKLLQDARGKELELRERYPDPEPRDGEELAAYRQAVSRGVRLGRYLEQRRRRAAVEAAWSPAPPSSGVEPPSPPVGASEDEGRSGL